MPKSMGAGGKILYLQRLMFEKTNPETGVTMAEILDCLAQNGIAAERKSIYSDIELLRNFGMDIELVFENGRREYRLLSREFDLVELKLLADAVSASRFITRAKSRELVNKLKTLACEGDRSRLQRQVHVDNRIKSMNESIYYNADAIGEGIASGNKIAFRYFDYTPDKQRRERAGEYVVSPLGLVVSGENYYLCGFSDTHGEIRNYRVDRMAKVRVLDEKRSDLPEIKDFDISEYRERQFSMFGGELQYVEIEFDNSLANVVIDYFGPDVIMRPDANGRFTISRKIEVSPAFFGWLFQFGNRCRLLGPESAREKFHALAQNIFFEFSGTH